MNCTAQECDFCLQGKCSWLVTENGTTVCTPVGSPHPGEYVDFYFPGDVCPPSITTTAQPDCIDTGSPSWGWILTLCVMLFVSVVCFFVGRRFHYIRLPRRLVNRVDPTDDNIMMEEGWLLRLPNRHVEKLRNQRLPSLPAQESLIEGTSKRDADANYDSKVESETTGIPVHATKASAPMWSLPNLMPSTFPHYVAQHSTVTTQQSDTQTYRPHDSEFDNQDVNYVSVLNGFNLEIPEYESELVVPVAAMPDSTSSTLPTTSAQYTTAAPQQPDPETPRPHDSEFDNQDFTYDSALEGFKFEIPEYASESAAPVAAMPDSPSSTIPTALAQYPTAAPQQPDPETLRPYDSEFDNQDLNYESASGVSKFQIPEHESESAAPISRMPDIMFSTLPTALAQYPTAAPQQPDSETRRPYDSEFDNRELNYESALHVSKFQTQEHGSETGAPVSTMPDIISSTLQTTLARYPTAAPQQPDTETLRSYDSVFDNQDLNYDSALDAFKIQIPEHESETAAPVSTMPDMISSTLPTTLARYPTAAPQQPDTETRRSYDSEFDNQDLNYDSALDVSKFQIPEHESETAAPVSTMPDISSTLPTTLAQYTTAAPQQPDTETPSLHVNKSDNDGSSLCVKNMQNKTDPLTSIPGISIKNGELLYNGSILFITVGNIPHRLIFRLLRNYCHNYNLTQRYLDKANLRPGGLRKYMFDTILNKNLLQKYNKLCLSITKKKRLHD